MERAVLITGTNGGIGRALCSAFTKAGYFVIATDKAEDGDHPVPFIPLDLNHLPNNEELQQSFFQEVNSVLAGRPLYTLVNNAAIQILAPTQEIRDTDFQTTLNVNVFAPLVLARMLATLLARSHGSIINIGSIHARATKAGFVAYATSKTALLGLTQALAVDLGQKVHVNVIQPAAVATEMLKSGFTDNLEGYQELKDFHPIGRIAEPSEIAQMAVFLASEDASFVTGATINIDGGIGVKLHDPD